MNLILYDKLSDPDSEILEFLKNKTGIKTFFAHSNINVIETLMASKTDCCLIFLNMIIPSDLGLIKYIKTHYPRTKIIVFASPAVKETVEIIKASEITVMEYRLDNLKKVNEIISSL